MTNLVNRSPDLREIANKIGYEWAMLLGACETNWHTDIPALVVSKRDPLRVVHKCARTELVWLHARVLHGCLFNKPRIFNKPGNDDLFITLFLDPPASADWNFKSDLRPEYLCPTVAKMVERGGRANKKLFHLTAARLTDVDGLPEYTIAREELRRAFSACYNLMTGDKRDAFREGLDNECDVTPVALSWP
jgi:hypothetical protein